MVSHSGQHCKFRIGIAISFFCHFLNKLHTFAADFSFLNFRLCIAPGSGFQRGEVDSFPLIYLQWYSYYHIDNDLKVDKFTLGKNLPLIFVFQFLTYIGNKHSKGICKLSEKKYFLYHFNDLRSE